MKLIEKLIELVKSLISVQKGYDKLPLNEKIQVQQQKVGVAVGVFKQAYDEVEKAEEALTNIVNHAQDELNKIQSVIDNAQKELDYNGSVKVKLSEFAGK